MKKRRDYGKFYLTDAFRQWNHRGIEPVLDMFNSRETRNTSLPYLIISRHVISFEPDHTVGGLRGDNKPKINFRHVVLLVIDQNRQKLMKMIF